MKKSDAPLGDVEALPDTASAPVAPSAPVASSTAAAEFNHRALAGGMTAEQRASLEERTHAAVNAPDDKHYRPQVPVPMGRRPDADVSMLEDDSRLPAAQRVGVRSVEHPRARMARAMHEWLGGLKATEFSAEALSSAAEKFGMQVDGSGTDGAVLKSDLVRAMDALAAQYPAPPKA